MKDQPHPKMSPEAGLSLMELMIALVFMAIGILAVAQMFPAGTRGQAKDRMMTTAAYFAQEKIERLGEKNWADAELSQGLHGPEPLGAGGQYARRWTVAVLPPPLENLKKVTVSVSWRGGADSVLAATYVRR